MMSHARSKIKLFSACLLLSLPGQIGNAVAAEEDFSAKQKNEINRMIRNYILENPEILPEAIQILQSRTKKALLKQNNSRIFDDGYSYVGGNKDGDVTMVEFFDYNCGYCKRALKTVERIKSEDKNIRIIYKELPILSETSYTASKAAMASINQGKYEEFHSALLSNSGTLTESRIFEIAKTIGLDAEKLAKDMTSPLLERNLQINHSLATALEVNGTPAFIIGEDIVPGAVPYDELNKIIKRSRQKNNKN